MMEDWMNGWLEDYSICSCCAFLYLMSSAYQTSAPQPSFIERKLSARKNEMMEDWMNGCVSDAYAGDFAGRKSN